MYEHEKKIENICLYSKIDLSQRENVAIVLKMYSNLTVLLL